VAGLMRQYGAVLGLPFGIEGLFFFLKAIFTAIYLYGWRHLPGWTHFWTGVPIAVSGILRGDVGDRGQLVDEPARRLHHQRRTDRLGQYVAGGFQLRGLV